MCRYCWARGVILRIEEAEMMARPKRENDVLVMLEDVCG